MGSVDSQLAATEADLRAAETVVNTRLQNVTNDVLPYLSFYDTCLKYEMHSYVYEVRGSLPLSLSPSLLSLLSFDRVLLLCSCRWPSHQVCPFGEVRQDFTSLGHYSNVTLAPPIAEPEPSALSAFVEASSGAAGGRGLLAGAVMQFEGGSMCWNGPAR